MMDLSTLQPGEIRRVPDTAFVNARQPDGVKVYEWLSNPVTGADQSWPLNAGMAYSIMRAENGAVFNPTAREIYITGGGHADGAHMGVYALKVRLPGDAPEDDQWKWRRAIRHPQFFNGANNWPARDVNVVASYNPDGSPVSRHTWGGFLYLPSPYDRIWIAEGAIWFTGNRDPRHLSWFGDTASGTWEERHPFPMIWPRNIMGAVFLPPNKVIWVTQHLIYEFDLDTGATVRLNANQDYIHGQSYALLDEPNQKIYITWSYAGSVALKEFDLTKRGTLSKYLAPTGDLTGLSTVRVGQFYSPRYGIVQWAGGNNLYVAKMPEANFVKHTLAGDTAPPMVVQGMFGKFGKLTEDGEFFYLITEIANDVYVGRMPTGELPDTQAPAAPVLTAQPATWS